MASRPADEAQTFIVQKKHYGHGAGYNGPDELAGFFISGTPTSLSVRIAHDGAEVFTKKVVPQYTHEEVNGQDCPTAEVDVAD